MRRVLFLERRHEWYRSSLDHVLTEKMDDIRESDEEDLGASSPSEDEFGNRNDKPEADQVSSEGFVSMDSDVPVPRKLFSNLMINISSYITGSPTSHLLHSLYNIMLRLATI